MNHTQQTATAEAPRLVEPTAGLWFVLRTKSRQEKAVVEHLASRRVEHFLPLLSQVRYYGRRKKRVELPMFPGYVFLKGSHDDAYEADRTRRLVQIIQVPGQAQLDWELQNIRQALAHEVPLEPYPYLQEGVVAEVRSGPMRGLQGVVLSRAHCDRLVLQIETLGQAVSMEIDGSLLDPVE